MTEYAGQSPIDDYKIPHDQVSRWRIEKEGYATLESLDTEFWLESIWQFHFSLQLQGSEPADQCRIPAGQVWARAGWLGTIGPTEMMAFRIDCFEVTNKQFKEFVNIIKRFDGKDEEYRAYFIKDKLVTWAPAHGPDPKGNNFQPPEWANDSRQGVYPPTDNGDFASFVAELVGRYRDRISHW